MLAPHHRILEDWMGKRVETLEDMLAPRLRAVCVGINPAPRSVQVGHYYQGALGRKFFSRLCEAGAIPTPEGEFSDDQAFAAGVGFTDIVKRPTERASQVRLQEYEHGQRLLEAKLNHYRPELVIFTFKQTARKLLGDFAGNGFIEHQRFADSDIFVMPGPYQAASTAQPVLAELAGYMRRRSSP